MKWLWLGWAICLFGCLLTACEKSINYNTQIGDKFTIKSEFYKNCTGYAVDIMSENTGSQQVLLGGLFCKNETTQVYIPDTWFKMDMLEKQ